MDSTHTQLLESILFFKGEPLSRKRLANLLSCTEEEIEVAAQDLEEKLTDRGIVLLRKNDELMLGTHKASSALIEQFIKDELHKDLGKAGLETLSIILYMSPVSRSEVDYIRGVNSNFIMRNLLMRGLVEKIEKENDKRSFAYRPTFELLSFLGVTEISDLPDYETVRSDLLQKKQAKEEVEAKERTEALPEEAPEDALMSGE